jgi:hypothetical protein
VAGANPNQSSPDRSTNARRLAGGGKKGKQRGLAGSDADAEGRMSCGTSGYFLCEILLKSWLFARRGIRRDEVN